MGWSDCGVMNGRRIGYGINAICDEKKCKAKIDRGLAYVCGGMHGGGEYGCGGYFCEKHLTYIGYPKGQFCFECADELEKRFPKENKEWREKINRIFGIKIS